MRLDPVGPLPAVHVRRATRADVGFLSDVVVVVTRAQGRAPQGVDEDDEPMSSVAQILVEVDEDDEHDERFGEPGDVPEDRSIAVGLHVIEIDGERAGRWRVRHASDHVELCSLELLPAHQGAGFGTHMVTQLVVDARVAGLPVRSGVGRDNPRGRAFLERLGFIKVGETKTEDVLQSADG